MATKKKTTKQAQKKQSFFTFQPTIQTVYWLILSLLVLALGIWVLQLTIEVQEIYNQIEVLNSNYSDYK